MEIVEQCEGCVKIEGGKCVAFNEPDYQWRSGSCWGRSDDPNWHKEYKKALDTYKTK